MYTIYIGTLIFLILSLLVLKTKMDMGSKKFIIGIIILISLTFSLIAMLVMNKSARIVTHKTIYTKIVFSDIESGNHSHSSGSFLGYSYNSDMEIYYHVTMVCNGGYYKEMIRGKNVMIVESDEHFPHLEICEHISRCSFSENFVPGFLRYETKWDVVKKIVVPVGTVRREFLQM